ncbi:MULTISPECIES: heavy-metal-associated domain-containing protein [unclassified Croceitalea]|uniref:heavy-metal-associated domain-containing protein n=1 Tax=unclassified Croceitalea TaxID=2632280 RepID=UPI0030DB16C0
MQKTVEIQNLKCGGCEAIIIKKLNAEKGVQGIIVDVENSTVSLNYDTPATLKKAKNILTKLGYPIVGKQNNLGRKAKSYVSCAKGRIVK